MTDITEVKTIDTNLPLKKTHYLQAYYYHVRISSYKLNIKRLFLLKSTIPSQCSVCT